MNLIVLILLVLLICALLPGVGLVSWGYGPSGLLGVVLLVVVILLLTGRL